MATTYKQNIDFVASLTFKEAEIQKLEQAFGAGFTESMRKAAKVGATAFTDQLATKFAATADELRDAAADIVKKQKAYDDEQDATEKARLEKELREMKLNLRKKKQLLDLEKKEHDHFIDQQEGVLKAYEELQLKVKVDKAGLTKDMGEALSGAFGKLSSGDFSGLVGSLGGMLTKGLSTVQGAGLAAGGAEAGGMAAAMASIGPAIAVIGASVGAIAAVAAVFQMAYEQGKKYNQILTEGAGAGDFFAQGVGDMSGSLNDLRDATFDLGRQLRMDTEEIAKFTTALNTSGVTYKEFIGLAGEGKSAQQAFFDVTKTAIVAAKGLGIEAGDAAAFMDKSMRDLGKTSLVEIQGAFGMIGDAAARSGMSVKSFFTAINEATSGMALHNIRLEDTIGLMLTMTKVLGEDAAKERAKMEGQFRQMGYQERIKTVMTTGTATTSKIVGADARAQAAALGEPLTKAIGTFGKSVGADLVAGGKISIEKLGKMDEKQYRSLVTTLRASNDANAVVAARQLDNIRDLAKGALKPGDTLAQADALGQLSKSGELAMQLASASAVLGQKGISSMEGLTRAAFEQITGMSGENFEIMKRLDRELRGQFDAVQEKVRLGTATEEEQKFAKMDFTEAVAAGFGKEEMAKGVRAGFTGMERMTDQLLTETQSFTTVLKNQVAFMLEGIYNLIEWIVRKMGGSEQAKALDMQRAKMDELEKANEESTVALQEFNEVMRRQATTGADEAEVAAAKAAYDEAEQKKKRLQAEVGAFSRYSSPEAAMAMSKVEGAAAAVGAGGGGAALAEEKAAREEAEKEKSGFFGAEGNASLFGMSPTEDFWGIVASTAAAGAVAGAIGGGGVGAIPGAIVGAGAGAFAAYYAADDELTYNELQRGLGPEGAGTGIDQLAESTGLTEEYTGAAKDTLAEMLTSQDKWFEKGGKPLAAISADQKVLLDRLLKQMVKGDETEALDILAKSSEEGKAAVAAYLTSGKKEALDIEQFTTSDDPAVMRALQTVRDASTKSPVEDFIYRGGASGGVITPINSADQFIGMKPGGSVERAGRSAGGTVIININGDTATIVRTVKDVLQKSGLSASPNNGYA